MKIYISILLVFFVTAAFAEETEVNLEPPSFMYRKSALPDLILKDKRENRYTTWIPAIGVDPDTGFNGGLIVEHYDNRKKSDPFFRYTPYRQKFQAGGVVSTKLFQQYLVFYDQPYFLDTPFRLRGYLNFWRNPVQNYFGQGEDSMQPLSFPGSPETFDRYNDFKDALKQESAGIAYSKYDQYQLSHLDFKPSVEYDFLGGILRPLAGFQFSYYWINDYTGDTVGARNAAGQDVQATQAPTKLAEDCASGKAIGCGGGFDNYFKLGLTLDTRDFEPDPTKGFLLQFASEFASKVLGSDFDYQRLNWSLAGYQDLLPKDHVLVLAGRFMTSMQFGDVPFFSVPTVAYTERDWEGLGGFRTMRGFKANRFIGKAAALTNWELRWRIGEANPFGQNLRFAVAPFWDAGRVFDSIGDYTLAGWKHAGGAGFRLAWNLSTVICFDYGFTSEGQLFYMELGYNF